MTTLEEHLGLAFLADLVVTGTILIGRRQLLGVTVGFVRFAIWMAKRPDRAPVRQRGAAPYVKGGGYPAPSGGHRGPNVDAPRIPTTADAPYARVVDGPREWTFTTADEYRAFLDDPPLLSDSPCIRWIKRIDGPHSVVPTKCATCGGFKNAGETHAPRPPCAADMIRDVGGHPFGRVLPAPGVTLFRN